MVMGVHQAGQDHMAGGIVTRIDSGGGDLAGVYKLRDASAFNDEAAARAFGEDG